MCIQRQKSCQLEGLEGLVFFLIRICPLLRMFEAHSGNLVKTLSNDSSISVKLILLLLHPAVKDCGEAEIKRYSCTLKERTKVLL